MMGPLDLNADDPLDPHPLCLCGKVAVHTCGEIWPPVTLALCNLPLCTVDCKEHRHAPGSMGYPGWATVGQYDRDEPLDDTFIERLKSWCRNIFWSDLRKAQETYKEICANFPPPAPWPVVQLKVGRHYFVADGPEGMKPVVGEPVRPRSTL